MTILYKKDQKGNLRSWEVSVVGDELIKKHGSVDGIKTEHVETVEGNSLRDSDEQALAKMDSAIKKRLKQGYFMNMAEALSHDISKNILGFQKPMKPITFSNDIFVDIKNCVIQHKLNGHRCLVTNSNGVNIAYSNGGEIIDTVPEILAEIKIPEGATIDGELYCHGVPLQTISSWVRRKQDNTDKLSLVAFDSVSNASIDDRLAALRGYKLGNRVEIAEEVRYSGSLLNDLGTATSKGYEGLILRPRQFGYEGKRSQGLIKLKNRFDAEYLVKDIIPSRDGWAILVCINEAGKTFSVSAPGDITAKQAVMDRKENFIGSYVTVAFPEFTIDHLPSQPVALYWRDLKTGAVD